jgi:hypothetical protein
MLLRHATLARNLNSILRHGLLTAKSRGKLAAVWAVGCHLTWWAALHVVLRHGGRIESTVVLEVDVPRACLRRHGGAAKGLWYSLKDVPASRIKRVLTFQELGRSPVQC